MIKAAGKVRISVLRQGALQRRPWRSNLILDQGMLGIGVRSWAKSFEQCALGIGAVAVSAEQTSLGNEIARSSSYGACGTDIAGNVVTLSRVFNFRAVTEATTLREVGLSWSSGRSDLFSRVVLDSPVALLPGDAPQVEYQLALTLSPAGFTPSVVSLFGGAAAANWQSICLQVVDEGGRTIHYAGSASCMEPSGATDLFLSTVATAPAGFGADIDRTASIFTKTATLGSVTRDGETFSLSKTARIERTEGNGIAWACFGATSPDALGTRNGLVAVRGATKTKSDLSRWDLALDYSWTRQLS